MAKEGKRKRRLAEESSTRADEILTSGSSAASRESTPAGVREGAARERERIGQGRRKARISKVQATKYSWPFGKRNLYVFLAALVTIIVGYIFLAQEPYNGFSSMTLGPVLLVAGYLVLLPASILVRDKKQASA